MEAVLVSSAIGVGISVAIEAYKRSQSPQKDKSPQRVSEEANVNMTDIYDDSVAVVKKPKRKPSIFSSINPMSPRNPSNIIYEKPIEKMLPSVSELNTEKLETFVKHFFLFVKDEIEHDPDNLITKDHRYLMDRLARRIDRIPK